MQLSEIYIVSNYYIDEINLLQIIFVRKRNYLPFLFSFHNKKVVSKIQNENVNILILKRYDHQKFQLKRS